MNRDRKSFPPEADQPWAGTQNRKSFTLIELLVVLALVAVLSVVVVMTLNPAELLKQARDSNRLSDLATVNTALNLFSTDVTSGFMGTSTTVYVSIPDNASSTCGSLGLPTLPTGYTYNCVTSQNLRKTDGTGWIPVNFQRISSNSPISQLPIDPVNTTSTGNYYAYVTGGSWMLSAIPESQKQKAELSTNSNLSKFPGVIAMGNNLDISPLYNSTGLVGYWKFDEGSGTVAKDSSGYGNNGTLMNSPSWQVSAGCKISGCLYFNGISNWVRIPTTNSLQMATGSMTVSFLVNSSPWADWRVLFGGPNVGSSNGYGIGQHNISTLMNYDVYGSVGGAQAFTTANVIVPSQWNNVVVVFDVFEYRIKVYKDGVRMDSRSLTDPGNVQNAYSYFYIGSYMGSSQYFQGYLDDLRVYNRALSEAEVQFLHNSTK